MSKRDLKECKRFEQELHAKLLLFEQAREWADLSNVLMALHKIFSKENLNGEQFSEAFYQRRLARSQMKRTLGRRLAQCLNAQLPSGVHLNTLRIYDSIFSQIGSDGLVQDLGIYSSGLFPHVANCGKTVQAAAICLTLIFLEKHYLPLKTRLEPCLTGLITALLPIMEDEGNPNNPKVLDLFKKLVEGVGDATFCSTLWLLLLKTPKIRLPGIRLLRIINNFIILILLSIKYLSSSKVHRSWGLVLQTLELLLEDSNQLVQRGILDFIAQFMPLRSRVLWGGHNVRLLRAILALLRQNDGSLNRRIVFLLTSRYDDFGKMDAAARTYFERHVHGTLMAVATLSSTTPSSSPISTSYCLRIITCLLQEVEEIKSRIVPELSIPVLLYL
ncbi:unnamed protein product, partial [Amoebophrya sp. A25]|eukprot:GSA25T00022859001.1